MLDRKYLKKNICFFWIHSNKYIFYDFLIRYFFVFSKFSLIIYIIKFMIYYTIFYFTITSYIYIFSKIIIFLMNIILHLVENFLLDISLSFKILLLDLAFSWNCTKNIFLIVEKFSINDDNFPNIISNIYFLDRIVLYFMKKIRIKF